MSIPRKRGKVKKKSRAVKKVESRAKKAVRKAQKALKEAQARLKAEAKKKKKRVSVNTKTRKPPPRRQSRPKPKSPVKKKRKAKRKKKSRSSVGRKKKASLSREQIEIAFLRSPGVSAQIHDRIVEKGLAELTRGMVRTVEAQIIGQLIVAEQLGEFDERARELAVEYNWSLQDIYTLWLSPETAFSS